MRLLFATLMLSLDLERLLGVVFALGVRSLSPPSLKHFGDSGLKLVSTMLFLEVRQGFLSRVTPDVVEVVLLTVY
jgi:hypothetical protein